MADEPKDSEARKPTVEIGKLTPEQKELAFAWYRKRVSEGHEPKCPVCAHSEWTIPEHLVAPLVYTPGGFSIGGAQYPHFMLACTHCGNVQFINALLAGVIPKSAPGG